MYFPWTVVSLAAIASSILLSTAHELYLPYLPSLTPNDQGGSYLVRPHQPPDKASY